MVTQILNYLHKKGFRNLLSTISSFVYFFKGFGNVPSTYYQQFRAYSYRVKGITYLSRGPGWAYHYAYLQEALIHTYNYFYMPKPGDCIVDIGAGLGEETVIYSNLVGPHGRVHALEANPVTHAGLAHMCKVNNFSQTKAYHLAVYNQDGELTIEDDEENYLTNTIQQHAFKNAGKPVRSVTLDTFIKENGISKIDFLKSNIEGAEQYLIEGMTNALPLIHHVCISCHDFRHTQHNHGEFYMTKQRVVKFLTDNGFEILKRAPHDPLIDDFVYARNAVYPNN